MEKKMKLNFNGLMILSKVLDEIEFKNYQAVLIKTLNQKMAIIKNKDKNEIKKELAITAFSDLISYFITKAHKSTSLKSLLCNFSSVDEKEFDDYDLENVMDIIIELVRYVFNKSSILKKLGIKININDIMKESNKENV